MLDQLTSTENKVAQDIINSGLINAARSVEQIEQSKVHIDTIEFALEKSGDTTLFTAKDNPHIHLLKTVIKGDLKRVWHLVLSMDEVNKIHEKCLPEKVLQTNSAKSLMMKGTVLTEIDNMLSAAMITKLANRLEVNIHGNIPHLKVVKPENINMVLAQEAEEYACQLHFKAVFHAKELDISPDFVWLLDHDFIHKIKNKNDQ